MFKDNLLFFRKKAGLTQEELATKCGIRQQMVFAYEIGTKTPALTVLVSLANALGCTVNDLVYDKNIKK